MKNDKLKNLLKVLLEENIYYLMYSCDNSFYLECTSTNNNQYIKIQLCCEIYNSEIETTIDIKRLSYDCSIEVCDMVVSSEVSLVYRNIDNNRINQIVKSIIL
jgi:hypothetical protein